MENLPIIDMQEIGAQVQGEPNNDVFRRVASEVHRALFEYGFLYIKNHGIPQTLISDIHKKSKDFLKLPKEVKQKYSRNYPVLDGYINGENEHLDLDLDHEIKDIIAVTNENSCFPHEELAPGLRQTCLECISAILTLSNRFLKVLAIALGVDEDFFLKRHTYQEDKNGSFRMFYYPPVGDIKDPNVARFGEHTDFGTITFLFQDDSGGMELKTKSGKWIQATPIKDTVILLVADLMSIWSNGLYPATVRRFKENEVMMHFEELHQKFIALCWNMVFYTLKTTGFLKICFIDCLFQMMRPKDDVKEVPSPILLFLTRMSQWSHSTARLQRFH
ncbi:putative iron/ascorbate oxidoreductase DDB_G0283291 isoform X2 [Tachypleus tridentatus]|uniref:putative iron/ascorbate oxidoreductase DDB_G0283291 isoform X2 n=1 Tax=Tachypleus tridentatus TaxID=6853 RepID=UPI003FD26D88